MTFRNDALIRPEDLDALDSVLYEPKQEELTARNLVNVKSDIPEGAETYSYDVITRSGAAKILAPGADDIPLVDADLRRETVRIYSIAAGFRLYIQELRAAAMANRPIETTKAGIARKAVAEKENKLAWIGDADYNITGLVNAEGIQVVNVADNEGGTSTNWKDKTGMEIIADLRSARNKVNKLPGHNADTLVLPPDQYELLEKNVNDYDTRTIRDYLKQVGWFTNIERAKELEGQGTGGTDSLLVFDSSPEVMELLVPMDITRHDEEYKFPYYQIPVEERCGGVVVRYPMAIVRGDGI